MTLKNKMNVFNKVRLLVFKSYLYLAQNAETEAERKKYRDIYFKMAAKIIGKKPHSKPVKVDELVAGKVLRKTYGEFVTR